MKVHLFLKKLSLSVALCAGAGSTLFAQAPSITVQPASQTIFYGDPVTFSVAAGGGGTLRYQWLRDGTAISSATRTSYTISAVANSDQNAGFSVRVTNTVGSITSSVAVLTVDPGLPGAAVTNHVLSFSSTWKYNQTNNLDGVNWTATNYNDSWWPAGSGLFAYENNSAITPLINTILTSPQSPPAGLSPAHAYYFRVAVNITNDLLPGTLLATIRADDGAMIYVNGGEAKRVRMPSGTINNLSFTTGFPPDSTGGTDATVDEALEMPGWGLSRGTNIIAASVHQANSGSGDIVWGMALDAVGYQRLRDTNAPVVAELLPTAGSTVAAFRQLEVHFDKGVKGVDAADLLVNGSPATNVTAYAPNAYVFDFPPQPPGSVQVDWSALQGIVDLTANSNRFVGGSYTYTVDPNAVASQIRITEFMAGNTKTIRDEDGEYSDWLEIYNGGLDPVSLAGWYVTDDPGDLTKWQFPPGVTLASRSYLLVWASGKDRRTPPAPLHTSFKLAKNGGGYLGLVYSDGATVVSQFSSYPQQYDDVSYGRDRLDGSLVGYYSTPTPGQANATLGAGFGPEVAFSVPSGTFRQAFTVTLSSSDPNAVIRYFLVTNGTSAAMTGVPNASSPAYTGPLTINGTTQVRARAFPTQAGYLPGPPHSETYLQLDSSVAQASSDIPIVIFHNMGGGDIAATEDQFMTMQVFDTRYGRSSPTNAPDQWAQGIFHRRGQATFWNPKPSLRVETRDDFGDDLDVPLAGYPAESDWVFYGINQYDKVLMHNRLSHQLYRDLGHYTSNTRFVEVYLKVGSGTAGMVTSSDYYGLYVLEEKIKTGKNRVDIDKLQPENTNSPSITGGYLLSIDKTKAGDAPQFNAANVWMTYIDPDYYDMTNRPAQRQYISDYLDQFYSVLMNDSAWRDPVTGYAAYIDMDSWIDYHLHQTLVFNVDALRISSYFYKPRQGKMVQGPLWDFDRCFGTRTGDDARGFNPRRWRSADMDGGTDMFNAANTFHNPWYGRLFTDPDFWQRWIDRYQELRKGAYSLSNLTARIDQFGNEVREATGREYVRWAGGGGSDTTPRSGDVSGDGLTYTFPSPGTWQGELNYTKWWFTNRVNFMDTNFLNPPVFTSGGGPIASGFTLGMSASTLEPNTTIYYTLDGTDPRLAGGGISPSALSKLNTGTITLNGNARVFARNYNAAHQNLTGENNPPLTSPWSGPTIATFYTAIPPLRVTELMYNPPPPSAGNTNDADNFEFIGLKNISGSALNLQGFRLRGGIDFVFPAMVLSGGQEVVVVRNLAAFQSRYGTGRLVAGVYTNKLANDGDHVVLQGPMLEPILDFTYKDGWYPATDGLGFSLVIRDSNAAVGTWSLKESWRPSSAIYGSPGQNDPDPSFIPGVLVNEALVHTDPPLVDSVELYNPSASPANIGGWLLTDDAHKPYKYRIPDGTTVPARGYVYVTTNEFGAGPNGFALSSTGDEVYLFSADASTNLTGYGHGFAFGASPNGVSFCRYLNSQADEQFVLESRNTLGATNAYPRVGPVVVSEIMYHPTATGGVDDSVNEFIELQNIAVTNVPLYDPNAVTNTWELRQAVEYQFPSGTVLSPGARLLVVGFDPARYPGQLAAFKAKYSVPSGIPILGPWTGKLNNAGDRVGLYCPDPPNVTTNQSFTPYYLLEAVKYQPVSPWPTNADGWGASLQRVNASQFGNDPLNWQALAPTAGQAPSTPSIDTQPMDQTVAVGSNAAFVVLASGAAPLSYQWQFNGSDITGATKSTYTVLNADTADEGNYRVVVRNAGGSVTSANARLTVLYPPSITDQPVSRSVPVGTAVTLSVVAGGSPPLSYQWRFNGNALPGQTETNLILPSVGTNDAGAYSVVITNDVGSVTSDVAIVTVLVPPSITLQPSDKVVDAGSELILDASAAGSEPLSYQWRFKGSDISGATSTHLAVANVQPSQAGTYTIVVTNLAGQVESAAAAVTVSVPPPMILDFERSGSVATVSIRTWLGLSYVLEYTGDLGQPGWSEILPPVPGTGGVMVLTDSDASQLTNRFYRIRAQ